MVLPQLWLAFGLVCVFLGQVRDTVSYLLADVNTFTVMVMHARTCESDCLLI